MHYINYQPALSLFSTQIWDNIKIKANQLSPLQKRVALVACVVFTVLFGYLAFIGFRAMRKERNQVPAEPIQGVAVQEPPLRDVRERDMLSKVVSFEIEDLCEQLEKRDELLRPCKHNCIIELADGRKWQGSLHSNEIDDIGKNLDPAKVKLKLGNQEPGNQSLNANPLRHFEDDKDKYTANEILKGLFDVNKVINTPAEILVEKVRDFSIDGKCLESLPCSHTCEISLIDGRYVKTTLGGDELYIILKAVNQVRDMNAPDHFDDDANTKARTDANQVLIKLFNQNVR